MGKDPLPKEVLQLLGSAKPHLPLELQKQIDQILIANQQVEPNSYFECALRKWARDNLANDLDQAISWHPIIKDEWAKMRRRQ